MRVLFYTIGLLAFRATVLTVIYSGFHYLLMQETLEPNRLYQAWVVAFSAFAIYQFVFKGEER